MSNYDLAGGVDFTLRCKQIQSGNNLFILKIVFEFEWKFIGSSGGGGDVHASEDNNQNSL